MKRTLILLALFLIPALALAQGASTNYSEQGGQRWVVGGELDIVSGGVWKIGGTTITASAADLNSCDYTLVVAKTYAGQQTIEATGAGNDITLTAADDLILTITDDVTIGAQDFLPTASATQVLTAPVSSIVASTSMLVTSPKTSFSAAVEYKITDVTVADDAAGTKPAGVIPITTPVVTCTCNDATGCTMSIAEPTPTSGYARFLTIVSAGTGNCEFADSAGVVELSAAFTAGVADTLQLVYANSAWHEVARSNN